MLLLKPPPNLCTQFVWMYVPMCTWEQDRERESFIQCIHHKKATKRKKSREFRKRDRTRGFHFNANANTRSSHTHTHNIVYSTIRKWVQWHEKLRVLYTQKKFLLPAIITRRRQQQQRHIMLHTMRYAIASLSVGLNMMRIVSVCARVWRLWGVWSAPYHPVVQFNISEIWFRGSGSRLRVNDESK